MTIDWTKPIRLKDKQFKHWTCELMARDMGGKHTNLIRFRSTDSAFWRCVQADDDGVTPSGVVEFENCPVRHKRKVWLAWGDNWVVVYMQKPAAQRGVLAVTEHEIEFEEGHGL